ncbi:MAG: hypothetical protein LVQ95_00470 [Candidatus Micrarchaeales archaeon]|nr:hypothetical protein [Candidatus Micrarchaeales archaeon]
MNESKMISDENGKGKQKEVEPEAHLRTELTEEEKQIAVFFLKSLKAGRRELQIADVEEEFGSGRTTANVGKLVMKGLLGIGHRGYRMGGWYEKPPPGIAEALSATYLLTSHGADVALAAAKESVLSQLKQAEELIKDKRMAVAFFDELKKMPSLEDVPELSADKQEEVSSRLKQIGEILVSAPESALAFSEGLKEAPGGKNRPANLGEFFYTRGIGLDSTPSCFVCGGERKLYHNISGFVRSKSAGERTVAMFKSGAWLDYRPGEPHWIQVKIGACDNHTTNLEYLDELVSSEKEITPEMVAKAMAGGRFGLIYTEVHEWMRGQEHFSREVVTPISGTFVTEADAWSAGKKSANYYEEYKYRVWIVSPDGRRKEVPPK